MNKTRTTALLLLIIFSIITIQWGTPLIKTVTFLSATLPHTPAWIPLAEHTAQRETIHFTEYSTQPVVDIYRMENDRTEQPGLVLVPGFSPDAHRDERLVAVARAMAHAGVVVAIPHSPTITHRQFATEDIARIVDTFTIVAAHDTTASDRVGISGFSIAGSYAIVVAAQLDAQPAFVHAFGPYHDAVTLLVDIFSHTAVHDETERTWQPDPYVTSIALEMLGLFAEDTDVASHIDVDALQESLPLSRDEATRIVDTLEEEQRTLLDEVSPAQVLDQLRTTLILMHDKNDSLIPVEASRHIKENLPEGTALSYGEYTFLQHVTPKRIFSWELFPFTYQVFLMMNRMF